MGDSLQGNSNTTKDRKVICDMIWTLKKYLREFIYIIGELFIVWFGDTVINFVLYTWYERHKAGLALKIYLFFCNYIFLRLEFKIYAAKAHIYFSLSSSSTTVIQLLFSITISKHAPSVSFLRITKIRRR